MVVVYFAALPQPPKDFRKTFFPNKDFKKLLDLPVNHLLDILPLLDILLLNYITTYKSTLPDVPKKSKSPPSTTTPQAESSSRPDQGSTFDPAKWPSTSAPQLIPRSQRKRRSRAPLFAPAGRTRSRRHRSAEASSYDPANPPIALPAIHFGTRVTVATTSDEMGFKKAVAEDLLADIPNVVTVIQHAHSFVMQAFDIKKELARKTKEAVGLVKSLNNTKAKIRGLIDKAKTAKQAQDEAKEKAGAAEAVAEVLKVEKKEAEAKTAEAQAELLAALATMDAEIKAADEKELTVPEDSPLRDAGRLELPFPSASSQSEAKAGEEEEKEEGEEAEDEEAEVVGAEDPAGDEEDEVSKGDSPQKTTSEVPIVEKSINQTLQEIDAELEAEKAAEKILQLSSGAETKLATDAE
ncbi:neurofilament medium polypeptide-like [Camellia sinensis]|uniref:neurofilament medium polypeptide-like n=1 Tax=Camellia sinensis TaxID=4442 RepID=UPI00103620E9|nr:neurofilament medium polypeptide-like [Camellia sinensis]